MLRDLDHQGGRVDHLEWECADEVERQAEGQCPEKTYRGFRGCPCGLNEYN
jgi:hypothetical protein